MKTKICALMIALLAAVAVQAATTITVPTQTRPPQALTNLPPVVVGGTASNAVIALPASGGAALSMKFNASAGTAASYVWLYTSVDAAGTNFSTAPFGMLTLTPATTTHQVVNTNWSEATLSGYKSLKLVWSNSAAGTVYITNLGAWLGK